jgi:glycosyltransferase involved in cell wall biosynthesis
VPLRSEISSKSCRILYLVGQLGAGGLERQLYLLLKGMDRNRYNPAVFVWNFREDDRYVSLFRDLDVPLHWAPNSSKTAKLAAVRWLATRLKPELIHSFTFHTNIAASWAALGTKAIPLGSVRSDLAQDKKASGLLLGHLCAGWPKRQIYNNFASAEKARRSRGLFKPKDLFVVRNGLDLAQFRSSQLPTNVPVRILGLGSLLPVKRWDRLLVAGLALKRRNLQFGIEIAGGGPLRQSLEKQAHDLGVMDCVSFRGHTDDVPSLILTSTFLAHVSDVEGCPNAVMEAMACGRPVVAMDAGDISSLVDDGQTGFVVRAGDDEKFVERMATVINNRALCRQMGEAGRLKAEREFGIDRMLNDTFGSYRAAGWRDSFSIDNHGGHLIPIDQCES